MYSTFAYKNCSGLIAYINSSLHAKKNMLKHKVYLLTHTCQFMQQLPQIKRVATKSFLVSELGGSTSMKTAMDRHGHRSSQNLPPGFLKHEKTFSHSSA